MQHIDNEDIHEEWPEDEESVTPEMEVRTIIVDKGQEQLRIDKYIQTKLHEVTRSKVQTWIDEEKVKVNGKAIKSNYKVRPEDVIVLSLERHPEYSAEIIPEDIPLHIVYEDDALMVINKPANMVVHPGNGNYSGTLVNAVAFHLQQQNPAQVGTLERIGLVHRIDKNTTGLILVAKTEEALVHLQKQFKNHTVHRRYVALVWGDFDEDHGTIVGKIARNDRNRKVMDVIPDDEERGKHAVTHYTVLERFLYVTLLQFRLETGRTHQIRVHAKHIGHPLFNDEAYGGARIVKGTVFAKYKQFIDNCFSILNRQALHAKELGFVHPTTGEAMHFDSELPNDLQQVIDRWRIYVSGKK